MKEKLKEIGKAILTLVIIALFCGAIGAVINYKIDLYKRKYPGTTTLDFWLDSSHR